MRLASLLLSGMILLAACNPLSNSTEPKAPVGTIEYLEEQRAICEARGGSFGGGSGSATNTCFLTPSDANQPCRQDSDCEGHCLARSMTCAPVTPLFGCHDVLMDGGRPANVCLN